MCCMAKAVVCNMSPWFGTNLKPLALLKSKKKWKYYNYLFTFQTCMSFFFHGTLFFKRIFWRYIEYYGIILHYNSEYFFQNNDGYFRAVKCVMWKSKCVIYQQSIWLHTVVLYMKNRLKFKLLLNTNFDIGSWQCLNHKQNIWNNWSNSQNWSLWFFHKSHLYD